MSRYFFNFEGEDTAAPDLVGRDLTDDEAAKAEGAKLAADIGLPNALEGELPAFEWIEITDEEQRTVARLPVARSTREPNRTS